ncbi:MAG: hypothetical protein LBI45_01945, partial [Bacteroidales bacterium]|nr:hypothetical protein [Bacteroidales bacterium]
MANTNFSSNKFVKYFREVSVVVIGVAITLFASYRLGINNEKRDMTLYLNTVKMELEENIKILDTARLKLQISVNYSQYLWTHDKDALDED